MLCHKLSLLNTERALLTDNPMEDKSEASKTICLPKRPTGIKSENVTVVVR